MSTETSAPLPANPYEEYPIEERGPENGGQASVTPFTVQGLREQAEGSAHAARFTPNYEAAGQADNPLEKLQKLHELDETNKDLLRQQLTDKAEEMAEKFAHNPPLADQYKSVARGIYWMYAGEPGEPLPDCFMAQLANDNSVADITLHRGINHMVVDAFNPVIEPLRHDMSYSPPLTAARRQAIGEAITTAPSSLLLEHAKNEMPAHGERPLTGFESQVRQAEIKSNVLRDYRMSESDLYARDGRAKAARGDIGRATLLLDEERASTRAGDQAGTPLGRARAVIGRELIRIAQGIHASTEAEIGEGRIFTNRYDGVVWEDGSADTAYFRQTLLDGACRAYAAQLNGGVNTDPANKLFTTQVVKLFSDGITEKEFDQLATRQINDAEHNLDTVLGGQIPAYGMRNFGLATVAWMRQARINTDPALYRQNAYATDLYEQESDRDHAEAAGERQALVDRETFQELMEQQVGSVDVDLRSRKEKPPLQLIMAEHVSSLPELPESHPSPVLRLRLAADALGAGHGSDAVPYLPGYRLAAIKQSAEPGQANTYDFVRDTGGSPYRDCKVPVSPDTLATITGNSRQDGLDVIADKLQSGKVRTVGKVIDRIRRSSHYYLPSADQGPQGAIIHEGKLYGQCTTFAATTERLLDGALDGAKLEPVSGLTIAADGKTISAMAHQQVKLTVGNDTYILDATPADEMAEQARKLTMRERYGRVRDGVSRLMRKASIVDYDLPDAAPGAPRTKPQPQAAPSAVNQPAIPTVRAEVTPVDPLERAKSSFGELKSAFEKQMAARAGIDIRSGDTGQLYDYMLSRHGRDGDPYGIVLQRLAVAAPSSDIWPTPSELSDEDLDARITELDRDIQYLDNLGGNEEVSRSIYGGAISQPAAGGLQHTLRDLQRSYRIIANSRR